MSDETKKESHTPGTWEIVFSGNGSMTPCTIRSTAPHGNLYIAEIKCPHSCGSRHEKDARLISQAPNLLEALQLTTSMLSRILFDVGLKNSETAADAESRVKHNGFIIDAATGRKI